MDTIHKFLQEEINRLVAEEKFSEAQLQDAVDQTVGNTLPEISEQMLDRLKRKASKMLKERRSGDGGFRRRHMGRWRKAFDTLEMLYVICEESGAEFNTEFRPIAVEDNNFTFEAVVTLHARALLVANEILTLLKGGFADGALSRWRSLHEIAVIGQFLSHHDCETAERYLLSFNLQTHRSMLQYNKYAEKAKLELISDVEVEKFQRAQDNIISRFGASIKKEYGWAAKALNNANPSFYDLERSIDMEHWRPSYRWASEYIHANYKPHDALLGMVGVDQSVLLVGPSNSGMTEPAHMMAISLSQITAALLLLQPNIDRLVILNIVLCLVDEVGEVFLQTNQKLLELHAASYPLE